MIIENSEFYKVEVTAEDNCGRTGLQYAKHYGNTDVVNLIKRKCPSIAEETIQQHFGM